MPNLVEICSMRGWEVRPHETFENSRNCGRRIGKSWVGSRGGVIIDLRNWIRQILIVKHGSVGSWIKVNNNCNWEGFTPRRWHCRHCWEGEVKSQLMVQNRGPLGQIPVGPLPKAQWLCVITPIFYRSSVDWETNQHGRMECWKWGLWYHSRPPATEQSGHGK